MTVDTRSLLLDAALFGSPAPVCRSAQWENETLPADQPTAADWEEPTAKRDTVEGAEADLAGPRRPNKKSPREFSCT
jgi:hypothetical protein